MIRVSTGSLGKIGQILTDLADFVRFGREGFAVRQARAPRIGISLFIASG